MIGWWRRFYRELRGRQIYTPDHPIFQSRELIQESKLRAYHTDKLVEASKQIIEEAQDPITAAIRGTEWHPPRKEHPHAPQKDDQE